MMLRALLSAALQALQADPAVSMSLMLMMLSPWSEASPATWWQHDMRKRRWPTLNMTLEVGLVMEYISLELGILSSFSEIQNTTA